MLVEIDDPSRIAEARRGAAALATGLDFDEGSSGRLAIVATEMATNIVKHAGRGMLVARPFADSEGVGIELLALDKGGGMPDLQRCLQDGHSTAGSAGTGLGAIVRQSDRFGAYSRPGLGTAILARVTGAPKRPPLRSPPPYGEGCIVGAINEPYPGETVSGDAWHFDEAPGRETLLVVDGSGHGPIAAAAAAIAVATYRDCGALDLMQTARRLHQALRPTRGAAIALLRLDRPSRSVSYVGIGNIAGAILDPDTTIRRMVSHNGTAGQIAPHIAAFHYPAAAGMAVILHSDGLSARWDLDAYSGLARAHPALIAGVLFRDQRRGRDDASIVVWRP